MTGDELEDIIDRLLTAGIPPTAIGHAFDLDPVSIRERLSDLRVRQYGVAELSEALGNLQWEAFDQAKAMLRDAPYNTRTRFIMAILSKSMSLTARQTPDAMNSMRKQLLDLMTQIGVGDDDVLAGVDTSSFVVAAPTDEDQDEIPTD